TFRAATQITEILARVKSYISGREEDRHVELVSLNDLVEGAVFLAKERGEEKSVQVDFRRSETNYSIYCDPVGVRSQLLGNILMNAVKFSPPHSKVAVRLMEHGLDQVAVEISDEGDGIPADVLKDLETKSQVHSKVGTSGEQGTGFGLTIAFQTAAAMGAQIKIETQRKDEAQQASGTTFTVAFLRPKAES
ncbi:hypothetical protein E3A20_27490, partial [Planctomyces bekefii]